MNHRSFKEFCAQAVFTPGQRGLTESLDRFFAGKHQIFLLKGSAGTGKTYMIKHLTAYLQSQGRSFRLAAPTGRAAMILGQRTGHPAATIHSMIYDQKSLIESEDDNVRIHFNLADNEDAGDTVYIIDEASMISNINSENGWLVFGSGFLLNDFFAYTGLDRTGCRRKVILMGDDAQLPPVNMRVSPALEDEYLKHEFGFAVVEYKLTEVVRQQEESGILANAKMLRRLLQERSFRCLNFDMRFDDLHETTGASFQKDYLDACENQIDPGSIIIAHTNKMSGEYNELVRGFLGLPSGRLSVGDRIIVVMNNYNYFKELFNGEFGQVVVVNSEPVTVRVSLKRNIKDLLETVVLTFQDLTIEFNNMEGEKLQIKCKVITNLLCSGEPGLSSKERKALYIHFKIRHPHMRPNTPQFNDALRTDPYFNALQIKFGYAVTCHKAQGGEWPNVFLNCHCLKSKTNEEYFRWLYTGVTRAKKDLFLLNLPQYGITSSEGRFFKQAHDIIRADARVLGIDEDVTSKMETMFQRHLYMAVWQRLQTERIRINDVKHCQYCEQYYLSSGDRSLLVKFHYRKNNRISKVEMSAVATIWERRVAALLRDFEAKAVTGAEEINPAFTQPEMGGFEFPDDQLHRQEIYRLIKEKINTNGIRIAAIKPLPFRERYTFVSGSLLGVIDILYNKYGRITQFQPQRETNSDEFVRQIIGLIARRQP